MAFAAEQLATGDGASSATDSAAAPAPALHVELVDARAMVGFQLAWSDLGRRTLEPNVFLDPAFALPLVQHVRFAARPRFLLAWEEDGPATFGRLVGLLPLDLPSSRGLLPRFRRPLARGFHHPQVTLGLPLLDADRGPEAFAAMLAWVGVHHPRLAGLVLTAIPTEGAFAQSLRAPALARFAVARLDERQRAALRHPVVDEAAPALPTKRWKELRRQRRRLGDGVALSYRSARTPTEIRRAAEQFMALEASGWKGRRGSALLHDPMVATFTRTMTRLMAYEGRCRIDSLERAGRPVAMGILLLADARAYFWKTTFDETFAALSPGVQFALDLTRRQAAEPTLLITDSCAVPDHPMIDRLWSDRIGIADLVIALPSVAAPGELEGTPDPPAFRRAVRLEAVRRRLRHLAKQAFQAVRGAAPRRWRDAPHCKRRRPG